VKIQMHGIVHCAYFAPSVQAGTDGGKIALSQSQGPGIEDEQEHTEV